MENDEKEHGRRRRQHLRVPVFPEEKDEIEANAKRAGVSVARYLRDKKTVTPRKLNQPRLLGMKGNAGFAG